MEHHKKKKSVHVLVVDDEPEILNILVARLKDLGIEEVETSSDGRQAYNLCVERVRNRKPIFDLIISDWRMPGMTGIDLLRKIRVNDHLKSTPFIIVSAVDDVESVSEAVKQKVNGYLVKPFRGEELDSKVKSLLGSRLNASAR